MTIRFLPLLLCTVRCRRADSSARAGANGCHDCTGYGWQAASQPAIRFEDATDKAGIHFTHSFGSRQLGSLLEGTGAGCIWFDYNNSGPAALYVVNGRPLDDSMHPYPLQGEAGAAAAQSSLSQQRQRHTLPM